MDWTRLTKIQMFLFSFFWNCFFYFCFIFLLGHNSVFKFIITYNIKITSLDPKNDNTTKRYTFLAIFALFFFKAFLRFFKYFVLFFTRHWIFVLCVYVNACLIWQSKINFDILYCLPSRFEALKYL